MARPLIGLFAFDPLCTYQYTVHVLQPVGTPEAQQHDMREHLGIDRSVIFYIHHGI